MAVNKRVQLRKEIVKIVRKLLPKAKISICTEYGHIRFENAKEFWLFGDDRGDVWGGSRINDEGDSTKDVAFRQKGCSVEIESPLAIAAAIVNIVKKGGK